MINNNCCAPYPALSTLTPTLSRFAGEGADKRFAGEGTESVVILLRRY